MEVTALQIARYSDYREFLKALFESKKRANPRFSFRRFSDLVGFKSPNYLQKILEGERNLSVDTAQLIAPKLKLSIGEQSYFIALVRQANATSARERDEAERARLAALKKIVSKEIPSAQKEVFSRWFYLVVRELFLIPGAKSEPEWICKMMGNTITAVEAANAVDFLCRCGFLVQTDDGLKPAEPILDTADHQMQIALMEDCHSETLALWAKNLKHISPKERDLGILNIPINSKKLPELRRRIRQFQDEILGFVQDEAEADRVVQLGTYLIPFPTYEE